MADDSKFSKNFGEPRSVNPNHFGNGQRNDVHEFFKKALAELEPIGEPKRTEDGRIMHGLEMLRSLIKQYERNENKDPKA